MESALNIQVVHFWTTQDNKEYVAGMHELNIEIIRRFDEARIEFAFPCRTVYLRQANDWQISSLKTADRC